MDCTIQFHKYFAAGLWFIVELWDKKSSQNFFLTQKTVLMILWEEYVYLNFFIFGAYCISILWIVVLIQVICVISTSCPIKTKQLKKLFPHKLNCFKKNIKQYNVPLFYFVFFQCVFGTQPSIQFTTVQCNRHNFTKWTCMSEKCRKIDAIVTVLRNLFSTACTTSSFLKDGQSINVHIFASFIKKSHPSPRHFITHSFFSINSANLI